MCIINHTHRFVFVHVPKNAGTSVAHHLSTVSGYRDQEIGVHAATREADRLYGERFGLGKHSPASQIRRVMGKADFTRYRVIGVTRDPFDRVVSLFHFMRQWQAWTDLENYRSYAGEFLALDDVNDFVFTEFFRTDGPGHLFLPQVNWLCDSSGKRLLADIVLRYESLARDLARLPAELGLPAGSLNGELPRKNVTRARVAASLGGEAIDLIRERYANDFEALGYETQPLG